MEYHSISPRLRVYQRLEFHHIYTLHQGIKRLASKVPCCVFVFFLSSSLFLYFLQTGLLVDVGGLHSRRPRRVIIHQAPSTEVGQDAATQQPAELHLPSSFQERFFFFFVPLFLCTFAPSGSPCAAESTASNNCVTVVAWTCSARKYCRPHDA